MIPEITDEELRAMDSLNEKDVVCCGRLIDFGFTYRRRGPLFANSGDLVKMIYKQSSINEYIIYLSDSVLYKVNYKCLQLLPLSYTPGENETVVGF